MANVARIKTTSHASVLLFFMALFVLLSPSADADADCTSSYQPSGGPVDAPLVPVSFCLKGIMAGDQQAMVRWDLTKKDSVQARNITLGGIPGAVTQLDIFRIELTPDGAGVKNYKSIYRLVSRGNGKAADDTVMLRPGTYFLGLSHAGGDGNYQLNIGQALEQTQPEQEPNDTNKQAQPVVSAFSIAANLQGGQDRYRWTVSAADAKKHWRLTLIAPVDSKVWFELYNAKGELLGKRQSQRDHYGKVVFDRLGLDAGRYTIRVGPKQQHDTPYVISAEQTTTRAANQEDEPNDTKWASAQDMTGQPHWHGSLGPNDLDDAYIITLPAAWKGKRVRMSLSPIVMASTHKISIHDDSGELAEVSGKGVLALNDLELAAGQYRVVVSGDQGPYRVKLETRKPGFFDEGEPNHQPSLARPMQKVAHGYFDPMLDGDVDIWQFSTEGPAEFWSIHAAGDNVQRLNYRGGVWFDAGQRDNGNSLSLGPLLLAPGQHFISIRGSSGPYVLTRRSLGPPSPSMEVEPNDKLKTAQSLVFDQPIDGLLAGPERDKYRFSLPRSMPVGVRVHNLADDSELSVRINGEHQFAGVVDKKLPAGDVFDWTGMPMADDYQIEIWRPTKDRTPTYRVELRRLNPFEMPRDANLKNSSGQAAVASDRLPVAVSASLAHNKVAAFRTSAQRIAGELVAKNTGSKRQNLQLIGNALAFSGDADAEGWRVLFENSTLALAPGASATVPFHIEIAPDSHVDKGVPVALAVYDQNDNYASTVINVVVDADATPIASHLWSALPNSLLGGVDVSRPAFGAALLDASGKEIPLAGRLELEVRKRLSWHDDLVTVRRKSGNKIGSKAKDKSLEFGVALAGHKPVAVAGLVFSPQRYEHRELWPDHFELQLSDDGKAWRTVLRGRMTLQSQQQAFSLPKQVNASYARLRLLDSQGGGKAYSLGDWKLLAAPGFDPTDGQGLNLAAADAGGHLVWSDPFIDGAERMLSDNPASIRAKVIAPANETTGSLFWVVGFHHNRAAQIARLQWLESSAPSATSELKQLQVSVSTDSPLGPWRDIGSWKLSDGDANWRLEKPEWARFVRFSAANLAPGRVTLDATLRIYERPASEDYLSALGEWGLYRSEAFFERTKSNPKGEQQVGANTSRAKASALKADQWAHGRVQINQREQWYQLTVPDGDDQLTLRLNATEGVNVVPQLLDGNGAEVAISCDDQGPRSRFCTAKVAVGNYSLGISEPRRSMVAAWDTSASVADYGTTIFRALKHYSLGLDADIEALNYLPFGHGSLLASEWLVHPLQAVSVLNQYPGGDDSSSSYNALRVATEGLAQRQGSRAVVLLTDAETGRYNNDALAMWQRFAATPVRVFSVLLPARGLGFDPVGNRQRMQDWAAEAAGHFGVATTQWEIDAAFARASAWLRRPKAYRLSYVTERAAAAKPGSIRVVAAIEKNSAATAETSPALSSGAVGLILDASGSMWKKINGTPRIVIARSALQHLVSDVIPLGTPVALRVFGDQAPRSCKQALAAPLAPLTIEQREKIAKTIAAVDPKPFSKTPIADSLEAMALTDLANAKGKRLIVLVTDGEETCDGDPAAVIETLKQQGIDVRLNIVGFAIEDKALKQQFRQWASLGGGDYFDAGNMETLREGMSDALRLPFRLINALNDEPVAQGFVGDDPIDVPAGNYRVEIDADPLVTIDVSVPSGEAIEVKAK